MTNNELLFRIIKLELLWETGQLTVTEMYELMHDQVIKYLHNN